MERSAELSIGARLNALLRSKGIRYSNVTINGTPLREYFSNLPSEQRVAFVTAVSERLQSEDINSSNINAELAKITPQSTKQPEAPSIATPPPPATQVTEAQAKPADKQGSEDEALIEQKQKELKNKIIAVTRALITALVDPNRWEKTGPWFGGSEFLQVMRSSKTSGSSAVAIQDADFKVHESISKLNNLAISTNLNPKSYEEHLALLKQFIAVGGQYPKSTMFGGSENLNNEVVDFLRVLNKVDSLLTAPTSEDLTKKGILLDNRIKALTQIEDQVRSTQPVRGPQP